MLQGGLLSSSVVSLRVVDPAGVGQVINRAVFVVRDTRGGVLVRAEAKGPVGEVMQVLSWTRTSELGRTLQMSITTGPRTLEEIQTF
jgi:hypothetical protein